MATPQLSPGLLIREVDLTVGRAENVLDNTGAIAGPFGLGPVDEITRITTEQELLDTFGSPFSTDKQYEYWLSAANYLGYGGVLKVVRTDDSNLKNAAAGVAATASFTAPKIKNQDNYEESHSDATTWFFAGKTPGTFLNDLKVCTIDSVADQTIGFTTSLQHVAVGMGITTTLSQIALPGAGSTSEFNGYLKGIITGIRTDTSAGDFGTTYLDIKVLSRVATGESAPGAGFATERAIDYKKGDSATSFEASDVVNFITATGVATGREPVGAGFTIASQEDWYEQQKIGTVNGNIFWKEIAPKPQTTQFAANRNSRFDEIHVAIVDDTGSITGTQGTILEKFVGLSKAKDSISNLTAPTKNYYKDYLAEISEYIYAGANLGVQTASALSGQLQNLPRVLGFTTSTGTPANRYLTKSLVSGGWSTPAQGINFNGSGRNTFKLEKGADYASETGAAGSGMLATLGALNTSYGLFSNDDQDADIDYLIMGPGLNKKTDSQAKANKLISIATARKDCLAVIGPHRADLVNVTNSDTQTTNVLEFFAPLSSSSYAVFDSGYKYQYDRFNNQFRYVPTNADVAGLMARTTLTSFPWFSPAGQQRGIINNAVKLAYNPSKSQRDLLYTQRINPVITKSGVGTLLFGDKTGLAYASAFDRINVRRLFLTVEQSLRAAGEAQLFELNDEITRANFVNIVEPYLRDVQAKRGLYDFLVICDASNNTPDVIDNNEFRADIFLKPTKSINYVTLTFVATRTGVSFEEVAGRV